MKKAFTLIEVLVVVAIAFILFSAIASTTGGCSRSEGTRVGTITKFSYKGIFGSTKSWEGDLALEGMVTDSTGKTVPNIWSFSVRSKVLSDRIEGLLGKQVKMRYQESLTRNPFKQSTSYLITDVQPLAQDKPVNKAVEK
jgi:prepilin-type N-terminal cleavage/methylation domain-containing protein